jgi:hypothetical protein
MRAVFDFVISPLKNRYNNTKKIEDKNLILNTEIFNHKHVSRNGIVVKVPRINHTNIKIGDEVIVHHNVFRRWTNVRGIEKNSRAFLSENKYLVSEDQIYIYKNVENDWKPLNGYCFVKPIKSIDTFSTDKEKPLTGIMKYADKSLVKNGINNGDLVGFSPNDEYEFIVDGQKMYRVMSKFITIKYEYQGNEEEYNPSWA